MTGELTRYAAGNARARALLAHLLGRTGLESLYTYPSEDVLLEILKRTVYADALAAGERPDLQLTRRLVTVGQDLLGWLPVREATFLHEYLLHHEVENLEIIIRGINAREPWERIAPYVIPLGELATIDPSALARATDLPDLVARLTGTRYADAANGACHRLESAGPFALEVALELDYYERLWAATVALRTGDAARARQVLGILYDILNLGWVATYRDVWELSPEEILNYTLRQGRWVTLEVRRRLAEERTGGWHGALAATPYAGLAETIEADGFDAAVPALWRFLGDYLQKMLTGYPFHIAVPLAVLLMQEIEIRDLRVLLAAKRLQIPLTEVLRRVASARR